MEFVTLTVIKSRSQVDAVHTDIRKSFDQVRHGCLLQNWTSLDFSYAFGLDCTDICVTGNSTSVSLGVPQATLDPFYSSCTSMTWLVLWKERSVACLQTTWRSLDLQSDVDDAFSTCTKSYMTINVGKCKVILIEPNSVLLFHL